MFAKLFSNMDLYKGIILASVLLTPVAGFWAWSMNKEIQQGRTALQNTLKRGGEMETIGSFQKQIENQVKNTTGVIDTNYRTFFEQRVLESASEGLRRDQFVIGNKNETRIGTNLDQSVEIEFKSGQNRMELPRAFIQAVCFNVESNSQAWKLRELWIRNKDTLDLRANKAPPPETADIWRVDRLVFATREPAKR